MGISRKLSQLRRQFAADPILWALWNLLGRIVAGLRCRVMSAILHAPDLRVGKGSTMRGSRHIRFGRSFHAHGPVWIEAVTSYGGEEFTPAIIIGNSVSASDDLHISCIDRIEIGSGVLFGSRVYVSDHNHGDYRSVATALPKTPPALRRLGGGGPVVIGDNAWIGHNVVIIGPAIIGEAAVIGANSVIRGNVPAGTIVAGIPAKPLKQYETATRTWIRTP